MRSIGGLSGIGAPISEQIGGESFIRHVGADKAIYRFTDGSGNTVRDDSHNNNNGTLGASTATPTWRRNSLYFDGGDYVDCGNNANLFTGTGDVSVSIGYKTTEMASGTFIIFLGDGDVGHSVYLYVESPTVLVFGIWGYNSASDTSPSMLWEPLNDGIYHNIIGTKKGDILSLYCDGKLQDTHTFADLNITAGRLILGGDLNGTATSKGTFNNARIFNKGLFQLECQQIYLTNKWRGNN